MVKMLHGASNRRGITTSKQDVFDMRYLANA